MSAAQQYLNILAIAFPLLYLLYIYRNVLQGIGRGFMPLMAGVIELAMRTFVAFTLPAYLGYTAICLASPIAWIGATIPLFIAYTIVIRRYVNGREVIYN